MGVKLPRWVVQLLIVFAILGVFGVVQALVLPAQIGPKPPSGGGGTTIPAAARVPFLASCPTGWTQDATLDGLTLVATTAAHGDVGQTGGVDLVTPAGTNSTPSFTGNAVASSATSAGTPAGSVTAPTFTGDAVNTSAVSAGTPAGTVAAPTFTGASSTVAAQTFTGSSSTTSAHVVSWPAGVPTFAGTLTTTVINHTHTATFTAASRVQGGTTASTSGTHIMTSTATGGSARAPTAGDVITGTTDNPSGGAANYTPAGTIAWPAGVPTTATGTVTPLGTNSTSTVTPLGSNSAPAFTGSALGTHQHTATATGTNSTPTFTGSALGTHQHSTTATGSVSTPLFTGDQFDNRSAFIKVIWCRVTSSEPAPVAAAHTSWASAWITALGFCGILVWVFRRQGWDRP